MRQLSYRTLRERGGDDFALKSAPERVLQFGEGNFLRAFVDHFIDVANEMAGFDGKVVIVQPRSPRAARAAFDAQDCLYTLYLRGIDGGERVERRRLISCLSRCLSATEEFEAVLACARNPDMRFIVSNTTEAGIAFRAEDTIDAPGAAAFPGKLTLFLLERYRHLPEKGFVLLPCELIDENGKALLSCVKRYIDLWKLPSDFAHWVEEKNTFCSTLVDRIVPGYPGDAATLDAENGYTDALMVAAEPFAFWAVEGPASLENELPLARCGLPVVFTDDCSGYKRRKVRILNGAHTSTACAGLLCGLETVGDMMDDALLLAFLEREIEEEILPTLDLPRAELASFAASVVERFQNPFMRHALQSITLNATSKWRARVLPSVVEYLARVGTLPRLLTFSFAAQAEFFRCGRFDCRDEGAVRDFFAAHRGDAPAALMAALCAREPFWGHDLSRIPGFLAAATGDLTAIQSRGMRAALQEVLA